MSGCCPAVPPGVGFRMRLVAVVVDDGRVLITRPHDTGIWRLPATDWRAGQNPNHVLRSLIGTTAGLVISPILHTTVRVTPEVAALVFTASPIIRPLPPADRATVRWLPLDQLSTALPAVERRLGRLAVDRGPVGRGLIAVDSGVGNAAHR